MMIIVLLVAPVLANSEVEFVTELEEGHHQLTLEGLADVDAGRLIDDAEIEAWIKGLETDPALQAPTPRT